MIRSIYDFLGIISGVAMLGLVVLLLLGPVQKFWTVAAYASASLLGTIGLTAFDIWRAGAHVVLYAHLYWIYEVALDLLLFSVVSVLSHQATPDGPLRQKVDRVLLVIAAVVIVLPFVAFHPHFGPWPSAKWFNSTAEVLNFGATIMNLALWGALVASKGRDPQLLKVSAGLGIRLAGTTLSYGIRHFIPLGNSNLLPNLFLMLMQLAGWSILCWAFWPAAKLRRPVESVAASP